MVIKCPHCNKTFEYNILEDVNPEIKAGIKQYMKDCDEKFKKENPCPKCGSHNVDVDWGTPIECGDCGHRWD